VLLLFRLIGGLLRGDLDFRPAGDFDLLPPDLDLLLLRIGLRRRGLRLSGLLLFGGDLMGDLNKCTKPTLQYEGILLY